MFFKKTESKEIETASAALEKYNRVDAAITAEVSNLQPLIAELQASERTLRDAEVSEALGEQPATTPAKARKRVDEARASIDHAGRRLEGLRARLLGITAEAPGPCDNLAAALPEINAGIVAEFEAEWNSAVEAFETALSRRAALEALIGASMALPEPQPGRVELSPEISKPHRTLAKLKTAISDAVRAHGALRSDVPLSPYTTYQLTHDGLRGAKGMLVVEATYAKGRLAHLIEIGHAVPARDKAEASAQFAANRALLAMQEAERQRLAAEDEERQKQLAAEHRAYVDKNFPKGDEVHDLSQGQDVAKIKQNSRMVEPVRLDVDGQVITRPDPAGPPAGCVD